MAVSLKTDLRFPESGQHGHGSRIIQLNVNILQIRSPNYERAFFMVHNDCVFIPPVVQKFRQFVLDDGMMLTEEPA